MICKDRYHNYTLILFFPETTFLSLVVVNNRLTRLSILLKLNSDVKEDATTPLPSRSSSHESIPETYCSLSSMTSGKCAMGCISFNGSILICGAFSLHNYIHVQCRRYSHYRRPNSRQTLSLIVTGGYDRVECLKTVEQYDPEENVWKLLPCMLV